MQIGIIGCGHMGSALVKGMLAKGAFSFRNISVHDKEKNKTKGLCKRFGIRVLPLKELIEKCSVIIIAVKPQDSKDLLPQISGRLKEYKHLVSIMAGVTIKNIEGMLARKVPVTRAMPNMAASVEKSITALSHNRLVKDKDISHKIFSSVGEAVEVDERLMDLVTAVSGSGPAYFMYLAECLRDAAVRLGMRKDIAAKFAKETLVGAGAVLDGADVSPEALRKSITSKKGTTEAALGVLMSKKLENIMEKAVKAAARRSHELSKGA